MPAGFTKTPHLFILILDMAKPSVPDLQPSVFPPDLEGASPETACFFYSRLIMPILILWPIIGLILIL